MTHACNRASVGLIWGPAVELGGEQVVDGGGQPSSWKASRIISCSGSRAGEAILTTSSPRRRRGIAS